MESNCRKLLAEFLAILDKIKIQGNDRLTEEAKEICKQFIDEISKKVK